MENSEKGIYAIYKFEQTLGQGKFGTVVRAFHKTTGLKYAIKIIKKVELDDEE